MLCLLLLLRLPHTKLIYVTSQMIAPSIIDYFLHLLPGVPVSHARKRLNLFNCHDASSIPLTEKILRRPRLIQHIKEEIDDLRSAHMSCFNTTSLERTLATQLEIPIYGCDPKYASLGSKSGSRELFRNAGFLVPAGFENLSGVDQLIAALVELKKKEPYIAKAVIKLNEGFSGEGNAGLLL